MLQVACARKGLEGSTQQADRLHEKGDVMLNWALTFLVVALIAAVFGFTGIAATAAGVAKILFYLFLVLFLVSLIAGLVRRV
jgi:uncharacterized membrane protein YtjA (UPF0391 family)